MSSKGWAFSAALGLTLLASTQSASAFCLTRGCNEGTQECAVDEHGCLTKDSGKLLHWGSLCLSFDVQQDGSTLRGIGYDAAHGAIHEAFRTWLSADCGDGQGPAVRIEDFGPVACRTAEYNQQAGNANIVMFRDASWPYENAFDTLALTTLIFNAETGEIYDADVEVNTFESSLSVGAVGRHDIDFNSVITHEIGHFLGLSHSFEHGSTMRPSYSPGNTEMASLEADDVAGICAALPPNRSTETASCVPRHGFSAECALEANGCQLAPGRAGVLGALLALSSIVSWRLRRATRRRAANPGPRRGRDWAS